MLFRASAGSDVGRQRDHNEDSFYADEELGVFAVADGVGGHNAGEVASGMLVEEVARQARELAPLLERYRYQHDEGSRQQLIRRLPHIVEAANERIHAAGQQHLGQRGMATTAVLLFPMGDDAFVCHVGDSRLYLWRQRTLFQVTEDHSLVMRLFKNGLIAEEEMAHHPRKNVILRSVGPQPTVEVDTLYLDLQPGDVLLLCSDGLSDLVPQDELSRLLEEFSGDELVRQAIAAANRNGGRDNITVVVVEVLPEDPSEVTATHRVSLLERVDFLQELFLFAGLSDQDCVKVNRILEQREYDTNEVIVREGEPGDELFLMVHGRAGVWRGDTCLTTVAPGGHFGELALVGGQVRSATVVAEEPCTLLVIPREHFGTLVHADPVLGNKVLWAFLQNLAERVRDLTVRLAGQ